LLGDITTNGFTTTPLANYNYDGYRFAKKALGNNFEINLTFDAVKRVQTMLSKNTPWFAQTVLRTAHGLEFALTACHDNKKTPILYKNTALGVIYVYCQGCQKRGSNSR
jgi:hypothetical protein